MRDIQEAPETTLGLHYIVEFFDAQFLEDAAPVLQTMRRAAEASGAVVLNESIHDFGTGQGVTGVVMLAESHLSIHTWPEHGYAAIDIFMCGERAAPEVCLDHLRQFFKPGREDVTRLQRGVAPSKALQAG